MSQSAKYSSWIHSGFFSGLQKLSVPLSGLFVTMILAHEALTKEEMGVWALFMSITSIIELIRQGLVKTAMIKYINYSSANEQNYVVGAALFLNIFITILTAIVMFFFTPYFAYLLNAPQLEQMLYLLQVGMLLLIPFSHFEWLMYSKIEFKGLFWTYFYRQGITLILVYIVFLFNKKISLNTLVIIYNIGLLAGILVSYRFIKTFLTNSLVFSKYWIIKLFHFGKYVFASGISTLIFRNADQMMLSPILGTTIFNASQNIAMRFNNLADLPSQTLGDILFVKSANTENSKNPKIIKYYYEKTVGASLCFVLPVVLFVFIFPKAIIFILAGPQYYDAIPYLKLISFASITLTFLKQFGVIMDSTGRPLVNFIMISFISILQILMLYYFIRQYQFIGAGYALVITHLIAFIITQFLLYKLFNINFLNAFKYTFKFYPEFLKIVLEKLSWKRH